MYRVVVTHISVPATTTGSTPALTLLTTLHARPTGVTPGVVVSVAVLRPPVSRRLTPTRLPPEPALSPGPTTRQVLAGPLGPLSGPVTPTESARSPDPGPGTPTARSNRTGCTRESGHTPREVGPAGET